MQVGELVNICSNDGQRIADATMFFLFFYIALITTIGTTVYSVYLIGPAAIAGIAVFLTMFPLQVIGCFSF